MKRVLVKGFEWRDRLTERERYLTEAAYFEVVNEDADKAIGAFEALLDKFPYDRVALNNLSNTYERKNRLAEAVELNRRAIAAGGAAASTYQKIARMYTLGQLDSVRKFLAMFAIAHPAHPNLTAFAGRLMAAERQWDSGQVLFQAARAERRGKPILEMASANWLASIASIQGRYAESRTLTREAEELAQRANLPFAQSLPSREIRNVQDQALLALFVEGTASAQLGCSIDTFGLRLRLVFPRTSVHT